MVGDVSSFEIFVISLLVTQNPQSFFQGCRVVRSLHETGQNHSFICGKEVVINR